LKENSYSLIIGTKTNEINNKIYSVNRHWHPLYYQHVSQIIQSHNWNVVDEGDQLFPKEAIYHEMMNLREYLFRYDRGAFWMISHGLDTSLLSRILFGWLLPSRLLYAVLHAFETQTEWTFLVQDLYVPLSNVGKLLDYSRKNLNIWPLWMCPVLCTDKPQLLSPHLLFDNKVNEDTYCVNIGVYGIPHDAKKRILPTNSLRDLEQFLPTISARKMLYANSYYSPEEFWKIYPENHYKDLRVKYKGATFPDVVSKVTKTMPTWKWLAPNFKVLTFLLYSVLLVVLFCPLIMMYVL